GIKIDGKTYIFSLSDKNNAQDQQARNTKIDGNVISDGMVISYNGTPRAVKDPAQNLSKYSYGSSGATPVAMLEPGKEYKMDVYFYLEGCDPDCSDSISFSEADLHLAFFGVLS
ncbi:MAG: hypothetical protein IJS65_09020, partial [Clostridia bacterium]|nr:hypothetical protein [Clostridia bacterium]